MTPIKEQTVYIPIPKHSIGTTPIKEIVTIDDGFGQKKELICLSKEQLIELLGNTWDACFNHMTEGQYDPKKYPSKEQFINNILL